MDISDELKAARAQALAKAVAGGKLCFHAGEKPASCSDAAGGTEIASLALPGSAMVSGSDVTVVSAPVRALAKARGVPSFWRVEKDKACVLQGDMSEGFASMTDEIEQGQMIEIRSWTVAEGDK